MLMPHTLLLFFIVAAAAIFVTLIYGHSMIFTLARYIIFADIFSADEAAAGCCHTLRYAMDMPALSDTYAALLMLLIHFHMMFCCQDYYAIC